MVAGACVVAVALADLLSTTLSVASATGVVSVRAARLVWGGVQRLRLSHRALRMVGPTIVAGQIAWWVLALWAGWALVFLGAGADAVISTSTGAPTSGADRVYYAGYLVATLGNGDFGPTSTTWQIASVLASLSGLLTATLAITFVVPVVSAVVERRRLAMQIASLGGSPQALLERSWNGSDFAALTPHLSSTVLPAVHMTAQQHLAYPVLHYFHNDQRQAAIAPMIAALDDALLVLRHGLRDPGIDGLTLEATRRAIDDLLALMRSAYVEPADDPPPPPDRQALARLGAAMADEAAFARAVDADADRRRVLRGFVETDGWSWSDVHG